MEDQWLTGTTPEHESPQTPTERRSRTPMALKLGLLGAGVVAGAVVAGTMTAGAATPTTAPSSAAAGYGYGPAGSGGPRGEHKALTSGTVKAVGASSITVTVNGADKVYTVNADTRYFRAGPATLSDIKVGDTVHFATSADGKTLTFIGDGKGGGPRGMLRQSTAGTVKAVGASSITVTVNGADKTYAVTAQTQYFKQGPAKFSDIKAGDAVHFLTSADGKTITFLRDGKGPDGGPRGQFRNSKAGTVKSLTASSITVTVNGTDKTYAVTADTKYFKNGPAKLSDIKAGDTVRFVTSVDGKTITAVHDGKGPTGKGPGGPGGRGGYGPTGYATPSA